MNDELARARALKCTACGAEVDVCSVCRAGFLLEHVICCRREDGHAHASCATARRRIVDGARTFSSAPPPASVKRTKRKR